MPLVGFEPTIPAGERPQTYALDRAATGIAFISKKPVIVKTVHFVDVTNAVYPLIKMHAISHLQNCTFNAGRV